MNSETKEQVEIKRIGKAFDNRIDAKRTLREVKLLCHMDHDIIIKTTDILWPPDKRKFEDDYVVCELMHTDRHQIILSSKALTHDHCQQYILPNYADFFNASKV
ncbi:hypothetical protein RJ641_003618 [Dillenia turbinata]|uniref:Protein kinase domain-containing protein n=1 Tax=Dillenia turbinata TaxID=194707 RepID=A0AAN8VCK5_9MAGN